MTIDRMALVAIVIVMIMILTVTIFFPLQPADIIWSGTIVSFDSGKVTFNDGTEIVITPRGRTIFAGQEYSIVRNHDATYDLVDPDGTRKIDMTVVAKCIHISWGTNYPLEK